MFGLYAKLTVGTLGCVYDRMDRGDPELKSALCRFETTMFWIISLIKGTDAVGSLPALAALLSPLLRMQEMPDPDFAQSAKRTLAYLKYTSFSPPLLPVITQA
jgi:hypothetical protein